MGKLETPSSLSLRNYRSALLFRDHGKVSCARMAECNKLRAYNLKKKFHEGVLNSINRTLLMEGAVRRFPDEYPDGPNIDGLERLPIWRQFQVYCVKREFPHRATTIPLMGPISSLFAKMGQFLIIKPPAPSIGFATLCAFTV